MLRRCTFLMVIASLVLFGCGDAGPSEIGTKRELYILDKPFSFEDFAVQDEQGETRQFTDYVGDGPLLVNLWATWCPPCVSEMPSLDRLQALMGEDRLKIIAVSLDQEGAEAVAPFRQQAGIENLTFAYDTGMRSMQAFRTQGLPSSFIITAEGEIIAFLIGDTEWDSPRILEQLKTLLP